MQCFDALLRTLDNLDKKDLAAIWDELNEYINSLPIIENWRMAGVPDMSSPKVLGNVYNSKYHPDGSMMITNIVAAIHEDRVAITDGHIYRLGQKEQKYAAWLERERALSN